MRTLETAGDLRPPAMTLQQINEILEAQARRIAQAVHDEAGQLLAAVLIRLEETERELPPGCRPCFEEIRLMLLQIENQLRDLSHDLRPSVLDDFGLTAAVELLANRVSKRTGLSVAVRSGIQGRLPLAIETAIYRVVQESLTNASRHAQATSVQIELTRDADGRVRCAVIDNGMGFDVAEIEIRRGARGLGLAGIRERMELLGGLASIRSNPGRGTEIQVSVPVEMAARAAHAGAAVGV